MSKYIDVDAFVEKFRMTQLLLKVWAGPDLTPEQEIVIQSGEAIIKDLIKFPAADVAPVVHGQWIEKTAHDRRQYFECSNCGKQENKHTAIIGGFCWNCGAKMDETKQ